MTKNQVVYRLHLNTLTLKVRRTTLVFEMCQTLFFPTPTKKKIAVWPRETIVNIHVKE